MFRKEKAPTLSVRHKQTPIKKKLTGWAGWAEQRQSTALALRRWSRASTCSRRSAPPRTAPLCSSGRLPKRPVAVVVVVVVVTDVVSETIAHQCVASRGEGREKPKRLWLFTEHAAVTCAIYRTLGKQSKR